MGKQSKNTPTTTTSTGVRTDLWSGTVPKGYVLNDGTVVTEDHIAATPSAISANADIMQPQPIVATIAWPNTGYLYKKQLFLVKNSTGRWIAKPQVPTSL